MKEKLGSLKVREIKAIGEFVKRLKDLLKNDLVLVEIFGSKIRGDSTPDSDIDILIVIKEKNIYLVDKIYDILFTVDPYYELRISLIIYSQWEYKENIRLNSPFIENLDREAVRL